LPKEKSQHTIEFSLGLLKRSTY